MTNVPFLRPRLTGPRFEGNAIPLEFLKDLAVIEEMVVEVAKWKFLQEHPDRRRSPRGFTGGIELVLTGLESGSTVPVIELVVPSASLFPSESEVYLVKARDAIVHAIGAAEQNGPIGDHLPDKALGYFDRIGRSLRDGEAIEFSTPDRSHPARLTRETRRRLVLASSTAEGVTDEVVVRGTVPEADQDDMTFEVQLLDGRKVRAPLGPQHLETILEAFTGYQNGVRVLVQGVGRFSRSERLQGFESVEHVNVLDPLDVAARLDELRTLEDGWLDGKGLAPRSEGLDWLTRAFDSYYPDDLPLPFLYPTAEGGIQAEWSLGKNEPTLEIELGAARGEWHCLSLETAAEEVNEVALDTQVGWDWLVGRLRDLAGRSG